jgi:hypothetical protein
VQAGLYGCGLGLRGLEMQGFCRVVPTQEEFLGRLYSKGFYGISVIICHRRKSLLPTGRCQLRLIQAF